MRHPLRAAALLTLSGLLAAQATEPAPEPPAGAARIYDAAVAELDKAFDVPAGTTIELPELTGDCASWTFDDAWAAPVQRAEAALRLFAQAARIDGCDFGPGSEPFASGYDTRIWPLLQIALLTAAHGHAQLATGSWTAAWQDVVTLCRHSRHVLAQPASNGWLVGAETEVLGLALLRDLQRAPGATAIDRGKVTAELDKLQRERRSLPDAAAAVRAETMRFVDQAIATAKTSSDAAPAPKDRLLRERADRVRARFEAELDRWLAPLLITPPLPTATICDRLDEAVKALKGRLVDVRAHAAALTDDQAIDQLAVRLVLTLAPKLRPALEYSERASALWRECR